MRTKATDSATVEDSGPVAAQEPLGQVLRGVGLVERVGVGHLPHHREERVVLEVASDAAQLVGDRHADLLEVLGRADARQHQDLRRVEGARRQDHLAAGARDALLALALVEDAGHPRAAQLEALDLGVGDDLEVVALHRRPEVGVGAAPAAAVLLEGLEHPDAVLLRAVVVRRARDPARLGSLDEVGVDVARRALVLDVDRAADPVVLGRAALVVLGLEEVRAQALPAPAVGALLLPQVVVERPAADVEHRVHGARPAQ